jgi:hypothetical protein
MRTKIKNIFNYLGGYVGYVSLFTLFIIVVILIISGFYGWQKYQEKKFPELAARGEIKGPAYYLNGIKKQIDEIMGKKDIKNQRAMELAGSTKVVTDKANLLSLEIPESWAVVSTEGVKGSQISQLVINNSYFSQHKDDTLSIIDKGAELLIQITRGENRSGFEEKGGHSDLLITRKDIGVGGKENIYHLFKEPSYPNSDILDDHLVHNGDTYLFRLAYNPLTFSDAEYTFQEILASIKLR